MRTLAVFLVAVLIAGCGGAVAQKLGLSTNCGESSSFHGYLDLEGRVDKVGKSTFFDSAHGDAEARDKAAEEITRELDDLDRKANSLMASDGECFYKAENRYRFERVKNRIAYLRDVVEVYVANREIASSATVPPTPAPPFAPATPAPSTPQPAPQLSNKLKPVSSGSGFIVSNQTFVLTNAHVIDGCMEVTVRINDRVIRAAITARDRRNDLALLRLPASKNPVIVIQGNNTLYPGDSVVAIGYPLSDLLASEGNVSVGIVSALAGVGNNTSLLQISNPLQPGNSGGPLFDMTGHVVGVIVSKLDSLHTLKAYGTLPQNVNFATKSTVAVAFMQASGVDFKTRKSTKELRPADVARKGRPATVPIQCWE